MTLPIVKVPAQFKLDVSSKIGAFYSSSVGYYMVMLISLEI